jgi:hypothetical protein
MILAFFSLIFLGTILDIMGDRYKARAKKKK